jgi:CheY-like chemotaxis protein
VKLFELVYIIEDDRIASKIAELHLNQHHAFGQVERYENGQPALEALLQAGGKPESLPDLILLDLNMPIMDGWEFLEAFSAHVWHKRICVCVLTSSIHPEDRETAQAYEAVLGYFSKPIDNDLLDEVVQVCGSASQG